MVSSVAYNIEIGFHFLTMIKQNHQLPYSVSEFSQLTHYSFSKRLMIYLADLGLFFAMKIIGSSLRFEVAGWKGASRPGWESFKSAYKNRPTTVNAFWHDRIFLTTFFWRNKGHVALVSKSFDGEYITRVAQRFGHGIVRGSSTRGGSKAFKKLVELIELGHPAAMTVDGPKGPRHEIKMGVLLLAKQTGVPVIPISAQAKRYWTLKTWDKLQIPKPFTKAKVFIGEPLFVAPDSDRKDLQHLRGELKRKLDELVLLGEQWRDSNN